MIECINICKHVQQGSKKFYILQNINLKIQKGEFVSIMGPSGSGKSTLLHILGLLESPSDGQYLLEGTDVSKLKENKKTEIHRSQIGFVFQAYHLIDELTVYENIETPLLYNKISSSARQSRVAELLDRFNIVAKKDLFPAQLSGGQQQLVGIARAMVNNPTIILADEPTGNLQSQQATQIMEIFSDLNKKDGVTIVQVTHSEANAQYGNRIIQLTDGWIG